MAEFTEQAKLDTVQWLACFSSYADVVRLLREHHGIETTIQHVRCYDPENREFRSGQKWRVLFEETRRAYLTDVTAVPIANQGFRLQGLHHAAQLALKSGQLALYTSILEQAAKEVGGVLTNERRLNVDDGRKAKLRDLSPEERREAMSELVRQAMEQMQGAGAPPTSRVQ